MMLMSMRGRTLKVGVPAEEHPLLIGTLQNKQGDGLDGWMWLLLKRIAKEWDMTLEMHNATDDSVKWAKGQKWTACTRDVALKRFDLCVGSFWETSERRLLTSFTPMIVNDVMLLIVKVAGDNPSIPSLLSKVFEPFSFQLWLLIAGSCLTLGASLWLFGDVGNVSLPRGIVAGFHLALMKFLGQAKFEGGTKPGKIALFGFAFLCLLGTASYTANLASFLLVSNLDLGIKDMDDAIKQRKTISLFGSMGDMMKGAYPASNGLHIYFNSYLKMVEAVDGGLADTAMISQNAYTMMKAGKPPFSKAYCDLHALEKPVMAIPVAWPIQVPLEQPIGYRVTQYKLQGGMRQIVEKFPDPPAVCKAQGALAAAESMAPSDLTGVVAIMGVCYGIAFAVHFVPKLLLCLHLKHKERKRSQEEEKNDPHEKTFMEIEEEMNNPVTKEQEMLAEITEQVRLQAELAEQQEQRHQKLQLLQEQRHQELQLNLEAVVSAVTLRAMAPSASTIGSIPPDQESTACMDVSI